MKYVNPILRDRLAAEYVLGTLHGRARKRFESLLRTDPALHALVRAWEVRLMPLGQALPQLAPSADALHRIEKRIGFGADPAPKVAGLAQSSPAAGVAESQPAVSQARQARDRQLRGPGFFERLFGMMPMGAMAAGLLIGLTAPMLYRIALAPDDSGATQIPDSYVGVLADRNGKQGMAVSSLRYGRLADIKQLQPVEVPAGSTLVLWKIDKEGRATPLIRLENKRFGSAKLADTSERLFADAVELAVSIEPAGTALPSVPGSGFVFRGLCGKFWR